jgi:hypothetical protein
MRWMVIQTKKIIHTVRRQKAVPVKPKTAIRDGRFTSGRFTVMTTAPFSAEGRRRLTHKQKTRQTLGAPSHSLC